MSTDELRQAQQSGTTLNDLAKQKGVSSDDLIKSITADLKADKPEGAPELSDTQLSDMASNIASGKRPQGPPPGDRAQSNLKDLADMLRVDVDTLLDGDISSLLSQSGLKSSLVGGVSVDRYA